MILLLIGCNSTKKKKFIIGIDGIENIQPNLMLLIDGSFGGIIHESKCKQSNCLLEINHLDFPQDSKIILIEDTVNGYQILSIKAGHSELSFDGKEAKGEYLKVASIPGISSKKNESSGLDPMIKNFILGILSSTDSIQ